MDQSSTSRPARSAFRRFVQRIAVLFAAALVLLATLAGVLGYRVVRRFAATEPYPESATGLRVIRPAPAASELAVAADPQAARAAQAMLARGGTAMDAALAAELVLGLVEPQSAGLGGGGFLLYWDAQTKRLCAYDGRETAPAAATPDLFMHAGEPISFPRALVGGRSVGTPGVLRLLQLAHARHARLPWSASFEDARRLSARGFRVSPRLSKLVAADPILATLAPTHAAFFEASGAPLAGGSYRRNPAYASVLALIAEQGVDAFYTGAPARDIAAAVRAGRQPSLARGVWNLAQAELGLPMGGRAEVPAPGPLSERDLAEYRPLEREPLCIRYRAYRVCSMPPPGGGVVVLEALSLLERFPLQRYAPLSADALHLLAEAQRLAFADRDAWLADPAFVEVPAAGLLDSSYVGARSAQISLERALGQADAGQPPGARARPDVGRSFEQPSTTHFSIVDRFGNVASMTSSIEFGFGSHLMVDGFLLNNQLTDFSFRPERDGRPVANAVAPGKRPRSAMSPTVIFDADSGEPVAALGSPGGPAIIGYVVQTIVALLDWKLEPQAAVALPHVINRNGETELEDVGWPDEGARDAAVSALEARGHRVSLGQQNSGLHVIWLQGGRVAAGVDPRREGAAAGR